jgi:uncharacterized SAM-binding protein YcdF (DUF218 family)
VDRKRKILLVVAICLAVILAAFAVTGGVILSHAQGDTGEVSYLLVLGTAVEGTEPSSMLRDRIEAAYAYLSAHPQVICIVSGYQSGNGAISEAECMFRELVEMGIEADRIWMEPNASSTVENLEFSLKLIEEKTGARPDTLGILSSEFHLLRAKMFAAEQNVNCVTIPAKTTDMSTFCRYFLREIVMVWYYSIF